MNRLLEIDLECPKYSDDVQYRDANFSKITIYSDLVEDGTVSISPPVACLPT